MVASVNRIINAPHQKISKKMAIKQKIKKIVSEGLRIPFTDLAISITRRNSPKKEDGQIHSINLRYIQELLKRFPELKEFHSDSIESNPEECAAAIDFYNSCIPMFYEPAKGAYLRSLLFALRKKVGEKFQNLIDKKIAESNLRDGLVERTLILKDDKSSPRAQKITEEIEKEIENFDANYQSKIGYLKTDWFWKSFPDIRGESLAVFFENHKENLRGKKILHFSPEKTLKEFFLFERSNLNLDYKTSDIFEGKEDLVQDITQIKASDDSFDLIICHRVLEHILDDKSAIKEMYRVLKPKGELNVSVPQSMNRLETEEWVIPDKSHSGHVRQYGRDFKNRLAEAGFKVKNEHFLLDKSAEEHLRNQTYPMRFYTCTK
jgi:hypothetical protein